MGQLDVRFGGRPEQITRPERDIAHCGPEILKMAVHSLDGAYHEPWFTAAMQKFDVTNDEINVGIHRFGTLCNLIITAKDPAVAARESGFDKCSPGVQTAIYTRVGQHFMGALFMAVQEVSGPVALPPRPIMALQDEITAISRKFAVSVGQDAS